MKEVAYADLASLAGQETGVSDWLEITQERVNQFAEATGDHQWIHVDVERATAESPFGGPIAHGYLTLALANLFLPQLLSVETFSAGLNIGLDKVRFPSPVPAGSKIRGSGEIVSAVEAGGGVQVVVRVTIEAEGASKPACVADTVSRFLP